MPKTWKVLNAVGSGTNGTRTITTADAIFQIEDYQLGTEKTIDMLLRMLLIRKRLGEYDLVMTSEYFTCFAMNLRLVLSRCRTKHVTNTFNQSRRLLRFGNFLIDGFIDRIFRRNDLFIVHSRREIELFRKLHNIPSEKFCFSPWGFDLPIISNDAFADRDRDYVCMIGRNNRDIEALCHSAEGLGVDVILITSRYQTIPPDPPANVQVCTDLSLEDCLSCIKHARVNLILIKDDERGAGHITAVAAMMLGVPQVVSDARVLDDYFFHRYNCIKAPLGNADAVRSAIVELLEQPPLAAELARNGCDYAFRWLTHRTTEKRTFGTISNLLAGRAIFSTDPQWDSESTGIRARRVSDPG